VHIFATVFVDLLGQVERRGEQLPERGGGCALEDAQTGAVHALTSRPHLDPNRTRIHAAVSGTNHLRRRS
jgi:hypothetical protein